MFIKRGDPGEQTFNSVPKFGWISTWAILPPKDYTHIDWLERWLMHVATCSILCNITHAGKGMVARWDELRNRARG